MEQLKAIVQKIEISLEIRPASPVASGRTEWNAGDQCVAHEIDSMKKKIENHMKNYYLDLHLRKPCISTERLNVLLKIFGNNTAYGKKNSTYIITTMLVQAALDTHDSIAVRNTEAEGEQASKDTQLTVLAGDYYSGLYYLLLSESEDIEFIRILADAIKEINELKIELYHMRISTFEEFSSLYEKISGFIIVQAAAFAGIDEDSRKWICRYLEAISYINEMLDFEESGEQAIYNLWLAERSDVSLADYEAGRKRRMTELAGELGSHTDGMLDSLYAEAAERLLQLH